MQQFRIEMLEQLLTQALQGLTVSQRNETMSVAHFQANLRELRARYARERSFYLALFELEIAIPRTRDALLELITDELASFVDDGRIQSITYALLGGVGGGRPVDHILRNLLIRSLVDGAKSAARAFAKCVSDPSCDYYEYHLLTGLRLSEEVEVFERVRLIPMPSSPEQLPPYLPPLFPSGNGLDVSDFLSKTVLRVDYQASPIFHRPSVEFFPDPRSQINVVRNSKDAPDFDLATFCQALSLGCRCAVRPEVQWSGMNLFEVFDLGSNFGGAMGFSWSRSGVYELSSRTANQAEIEESKSLYESLMTLPEDTRNFLRVPIDRWTKSNAQPDLVDRMIDLGIALESLYLHGDGYRGELRFRFALRAAWHLGTSALDRTNLHSEFRKIYDWRSRAVHSGSLDSRNDAVASDPRRRREFVDQTQELCSQSIRSIIEQGIPDWDALVLSDG